jgi:C-5 cytosine-specific DNA methylase
MTTTFRNAYARQKMLLKQQSRRPFYPLDIFEIRFEVLTEAECTAGDYLSLKDRRSRWRSLGNTDMDSPDSLRFSGERLDKALNGTSRSQRCQVYKTQPANPFVIEIPDEGDDQTGIQEISYRFASAGLDNAVKTDAASQKRSFQGYTYGDICKFIHPSFLLHKVLCKLIEYLLLVCGIGGATRGAKLAGLSIKFGLDCDPQAAETWRENFLGADYYEMTVDQITSKHSGVRLSAYYVDTLHISLPCQFFSPMKTIEGRNDFENRTAILYIEEILKRTRPRIVSLEETFGILHPKFQNEFNTTIQAFTSMGFSVR